MIISGADVGQKARFN